MKTAFIVITIHRIAETVLPAVSLGVEHSKFLHISSPIRAATVAEPTIVETLSVSNANIDLNKSSHSDVYIPVCAARVKDFDAPRNKGLVFTTPGCNF